MTFPFLCIKSEEKERAREGGKYRRNVIQRKKIKKVADKKQDREREEEEETTTKSENTIFKQTKEREKRKG